MGANALCYAYCNSIFSNSNSRKGQIRSQYKIQLKGSEFKSICIDILERYFED